MTVDVAKESSTIKSEQKITINFDSFSSSTPLIVILIHLSLELCAFLTKKEVIPFPFFSTLNMLTLFVCRLNIEHIRAAAAARSMTKART